MFKGIGTGAGILLASIIGIVAIIFIGGAISIATANFRGTVDKNEKINADGGYRIAAYDEFYSLCSSIQSQADGIENQEEELENTEDPDRKETLESGILAMKNSRAETINEYNSKAAATGTRGQFRDSDLPYEIDSDEEVSCNG